MYTVRENSSFHLFTKTSHLIYPPLPRLLRLQLFFRLTHPGEKTLKVQTFITFCSPQSHQCEIFMLSHSDQITFFSKVLDTLCQITCGFNSLRKKPLKNVMLKKRQCC